jgi:hypothetical protein
VVKLTINDRIKIGRPNAASYRPARSPTVRSQPSTSGMRIAGIRRRRASSPPASSADTCAISPAVGRAANSPAASAAIATAV